MDYNSYIKSFFLILCTIYLYKKLLNIDNPTKFSISIDIFFSLLVASSVLVIKEQFQPFRLITIALFVCSFSIILYHQDFKVSAVVTVISIGCAHLVGMVGSAFAFLCTYYILGLKLYHFGVELVTVLLTGIFHLLLVKILFSFPRLRKGMPFLKNERFADIGVVISLFVACCSVLTTTELSVRPLIVVVLVFGLVLLLWWLNQLQVTYREKHSANIEARLDREIIRLREENADLVQKNYELSRLIHSDNKLLPALELAFRDTLDAARFEDPAREQSARSAHSFIQSLAASRNLTLAQYDRDYGKLPETGVPAVDKAVRYMAQRAAAQNVAFHFTVMGSVDYFAGHVIPEDDLATLVLDLLDNALHAVEDAGQKNILLTVGIVDGAYVLAVYDSGAAFQPYTIRRMGLERATTRQAEGGSGIGLMTTWETIRACRASFVLDETIDNPLYTKAVSIHFDGLDQTRIISRRSEVLALSQDRTDMIFGRETKIPVQI